MTRFSHIHASGRFNQSPAEFAVELKAYRAMASVITLTEVDKNTRATLLDENGWDGVWGDKGPRDDCGVSWDKTVWEKVWAGTVTVSPKRYKNDRGWLADTTEAAYAVLKHKVSGDVVVFGSLHTPHGMQDELRKGQIKSDVGIAYVSIVNGYRRHARRLEKQYKATAVALSGDWNLNLRSAWVRVWLNRYSRVLGLKVNWTGNLPRAGTHNKEIIDATLYKGLRLAAFPNILRKYKGNDHVAYKNVFVVLRTTQ